MPLVTAFEQAGPRRWSRDRVLRDLGAASVSVVQMPYQQGRATTLGAFLRSGAFLRNLTDTAAIDAASPPPFVFDGGALLARSPLDDDLKPDPSLFDIDNGGILLRQMSISPPLAGAHPHYHQGVFNVLVSGERRWSLRPPAAAAFRLEPALHHFYRLRFGREHPKAKASSTVAADDGAAVAGQWVDVIQRAGEVLYVPPDWQHSTLSLSDSVAVAVEFV